MPETGEGMSGSEAANDPSTDVFHGVKTADDFRKRVVEEGGMCSDGPIDHRTFERGWAGNAGNFSHVHYWRRIHVFQVPMPGAIYKPICSDNPDRQFWHTKRWPMFYPGNWTRCAHCVRVLAKRGLM